jgi:sialic acid synthase SpsE
MNVFSIAEIGVNHLGSFDKALRMMYKARDVGASAVKFQKYNPIKVLGKNHPALNDAHQLSWAELTQLSKEAHWIGLKFGCSVFDVNDVPIVDAISDFHKVASRMNLRQEFISAIDKCKKPTYISIQPELGIRIPDRFNLLWCIREYPSLKEDVLKYTYNKNFGLSSHCPDWTASYEAVKQGATVIENHVKESDEDLGCDMSSSLNFNDYELLLKAVAAFRREVCPQTP